MGTILLSFLSFLGIGICLKLSFMGGRIIFFFSINDDMDCKVFYYEYIFFIRNYSLKIIYK